MKVEIVGDPGAVPAVSNRGRTIVMTNSTRRELLRAVEEISSASPDVRLGQLLVNLAYLARGPSAEAIWDVEDDELLRAAEKHLENLRAGHASVA